VPAKTAEPIEMPIGDNLGDSGGPKEPCIKLDQNHPGTGTILSLSGPFKVAVSAALFALKGIILSSTTALVKGIIQCSITV